MSDPRRADRRRQALSFAVTVSVAVWGAVAGIVALVQPPRWVTGLLVLGALALTLWGAVLAYRQQRREASERAAVWKATVETALPAGLGRVRDTNPYEATLVEPASRAERYMRPGELRPPYVARRQDPEIERALADPDKHVVLVQGPPRSGKGRSVFEAVTRTMPDHWLVVPGGFEGLEVLRSPWPPCPPGQPVLLWLNELRDFVRPGGLPSAWLDRWAQTAQLKLVALARDGDCADLGRAGEVHQGLRDTLARFDRLPFAVSVRLAGRHTEQERADIRLLYWDEDVPGSLGDHLVTADRHLERFQHAEQDHPEGFLVIWSCAVAQHLVRRSRVDPNVVQSLYRDGRRRWPSTRGLSMDGFGDGVDYAAAAFSGPGGRFAPLLRHDGQDGTTTWYSVPHYLVEQVVDGLLAGSPASSAERLPDDLWSSVLAEASAFDSLMMGLVAYDAGDRERAEVAWIQAAASPDPTLRATAAINLAELLREAAAATQDVVRREELLGRALELLDQARRTQSASESPRADRLQGEVLAQLGRPEQAAAAYQRAMASAHPDERPRATWRAGLLRLQQHDSDGARQLLAAAVDSGHYDVAPRAALDLARLLLHHPSQRRPGDRLAAIQALELAAQLGPPDVAKPAGHELAEALRQITDPTRALQALTQATASGDPAVASSALGQLGVAEALTLADELAQIGEVDRATMAYRLITSWDDHPQRARAALSLGLLLGQRDPPAARDAFRLAISAAAGDRELAVLGRLELARALQEQDDPVAAIQEYRAAAQILALDIPDLVPDRAAPRGRTDAPAGGDRALASEQRRVRPQVVNGLVAAFGQVIDQGPGTEVPRAAERLARHHVRQQDTKAVRELINRVAALKDQAVAGPVSLWLANYFNDADRPGFALAVYEANPELAKEAADVVADLRRELARPTWTPTGGVPDQIPGRPPPPPIDPSRGA